MPNQKTSSTGLVPDAVLQALSVAVYTLDAQGKVVFFNEAASELWGCVPHDGKDPFASACHLCATDGTRLPYAACPMIQALRSGEALRDVEAIVERADGARLHAVVSATPLFDAAGALSGVVNLLIDMTKRQQSEVTTQRLAAIIESSDDAILAKDLNGIIMSWNEGAQRLFGYTAEEVIGKPVTILIPEDRQNEEPLILSRIRAGDRIDHFDTIRQRKDGSFVDISLSVSPIRNVKGEIVGASKIARDITERRRAEEHQTLLVREMDHRVKNLFALASSVVTLSARTATKVEDLATSVRARLSALSRAHALTLTKIADGSGAGEQTTTMHALIRTIVSPFDSTTDTKKSRVHITGPDISVSGGSITNLAMLLHEFATNAAKYGALSTPAGDVLIECSEEGGQFALLWTENGGPEVRETKAEGFGTLLAQATVKSQLGGEITRRWEPHGLTIRLSVAKDRLNPRGIS
ncbi:MAG TPA: PAS domain S-box protein [Methylovirgula sp.]